GSEHDNKILLCVIIRNAIPRQGRFIIRLLTCVRISVDPPRPVWGRHDQTAACLKRNLPPAGGLRHRCAGGMEGRPLPCRGVYTSVDYIVDCDWDPAKSLGNLRCRGFDSAFASQLFHGVYIEYPDDRRE